MVPAEDEGQLGCTNLKQEFVLSDLKMQKFADIEATVKFIRLVDRLFDGLNSERPLATEYKSVLKPSNEQFWRPFL
jgi:hypothetical protein